jgi:hypothetical protein
MLRPTAVQVRFERPGISCCAPSSPAAVQEARFGRVRDRRVNQVHAHRTQLRTSMLGQDLKIIAVGEIRDSETGEIADSQSAARCSPSCVPTASARLTAALDLDDDIRRPICSGARAPTRSEPSHAAAGSPSCSRTLQDKVCAPGSLAWAIEGCINNCYQKTR